MTQSTAKMTTLLLNAHADLVTELINCRPHRILGCADAADFRERGEHLIAIAKAFDAYILAIGEDIKQHARGSVDMAVFTNVVSDAVDGMASYEIECCAEGFDLEEQRYQRDERRIAAGIRS